MTDRDGCPCGCGRRLPTTRAAVPAMAAGRDLDVAVHTRVMGHHDAHGFEQQQWHDVLPASSVYSRCCRRCGALMGGGGRGQSGPCRPQIPPYSTDIAAAWLVVERMKELSLKPAKERRTRSAMEVGIALRRRFVHEMGDDWGTGGLIELLWLSEAEAAERICRAALLALLPEEGTS